MQLSARLHQITKLVIHEELNDQRAEHLKDIIDINVEKRR